jgi:hypothetical protein
MYIKLTFSIYYLIFQIQKILLIISYYFVKIFKINKVKYDYSIGVEEIAGFNFKYKKIFENSFNISFNYNTYYDNKYNFKSSRILIIRYLQRLFIAPILLGYLINKSDNFIYIWNTGFLINKVDHRHFEFNFLKSKKKHLICIYLGSDIRSSKLLREFGEKLDIDTISHLDYYLSKNIDVNENFIKNIALTSEKFANIIFSAEYDQTSYFKKKLYFPYYMHEEKEINYKDASFDFFNNIRILHAPTHPFLKGTPLIRAAIKKLKIEGYKFIYIELKNEQNNKIIKELKSTHIVINQLYSFVPSVFGIEAMSNNCCLVTSADQTIEKSLPIDSNQAWLVTKYWEIYDNLKFLLDNPQQIKRIADRGTAYIHSNFSFKAARDYYINLFEQNKILRCGDKF